MVTYITFDIADRQDRMPGDEDPGNSRTRGTYDAWDIDTAIITWAVITTGRNEVRG